MMHRHDRSHFRYQSHVLAALLAIFLIQFATATAPTEASRDASRPASPATTPTGNGCDMLGPYFQQMADLILPNEGLAILKTVNNDVLALTTTQAATVITSLDGLIRQAKAITPPPAAGAYHLAYLDLITWYRDMTTTRDLLTHQRLINGDKRIVPAIGRGIHLGQTTCGANVWNAARDAAFPAKP
ncbi:MAG: hypothetical protein ACR2OU_03235 [Thermomicrobiales bacterium]